MGLGAAHVTILEVGRDYEPINKLDYHHLDNYPVVAWMNSLYEDVFKTYSHVSPDLEQTCRALCVHLWTGCWSLDASHPLVKYGILEYDCPEFKIIQTSVAVLSRKLLAFIIKGDRERFKKIAELIAMQMGGKSLINIGSGPSHIYFLAAPMEK